jgi:hypothetical protein
VAISLVQSSVVLNPGSAAGNFGGNTTAGNCVVVVLCTYAITNVAISTSAVTLGGSGTGFSQAASVQSGFAASDTQYIGVWVQPNTPGGQTAVAATVSNATWTNGAGLFLLEFSGVALSSPVDVTANSSSTTGTALTSGTTTGTALANEMAVAALYPDNGVNSGSESGSYTTLTMGTTPIVAALGYALQAASGTTASYTATGGSSGPWSGLIVTLKPPSTVVTPARLNQPVARPRRSTSRPGRFIQPQPRPPVSATNKTAQAALAGTGTLTATAAVTKSFAASLAGTGTLTAAASKPGQPSRLNMPVRRQVSPKRAGVTYPQHAVPTFPPFKMTGASLSGTGTLTASATTGGLVPTVVQQRIGGSINVYGYVSTPVSTAGGNGLVVFAGWNLHNAPTDAPVPAAYVTDSAGNYWYHLGTSGAGGYGSRTAIWCAPNAFAVEWVSVGLTAFANSLVFTVVEFNNFPDFLTQDISTTAFVNASNVTSVETFTSPGSGTYLAQPSVSSLNVRCWGAGGGGSGGSGFKGGANPAGGPGGGGGEYAAESALAVTAGHSYSYTVGAGGGRGQLNEDQGIDVSGSAGGNSTFAGNSVTVTAHGGHGGGTSSGGAGGSGSTNSTHHNGGAGGSRSAAKNGMGGGGSGGTSNAGNSVVTDSQLGAVAVTGGGIGGIGGNTYYPFHGNSPGAGPGGGGGGGGANNGSGINGGAGIGSSGFNGQVTVSYTVSSPVSLQLQGTTTAADLGFTCLGAGAFGNTLTVSPGAPWNSLTSCEINATDGMQIFPFWAVLPSSTQETVNFTVSPEISLSGVFAAIQQSPAPPVQLNPSFPVLKVEAAFGFSPGDQTSAPPTWTDITARCIAGTGDAFIECTYGQEYELSTPEAGELTIGINNVDGAFTPDNPASPYYPYVVLGTPVRVSAFWANIWYPVAYGYVERWPQEWPDLPQWGISKMVATDAISILNSVTMPSALQGDILADAPYAYLPLSEEYLTFQNGFAAATGSLKYYSQANPAGLQAANASRVNQLAGVYANGTGTNGPQCETGDALNLFGDQGTAMGVSSLSGSIAYTGPITGAGMVYNDPNMPNPTSANGCSIEVWFVYAFPETLGQGVTLFSAYGMPSTYWPTGTVTPVSTGPAAVNLSLNSTSNTIQLTLNGTSNSVGSFTPGPGPQQIVVTWPASNSNVLTVYLNGSQTATVTLSGSEVEAWRSVVAGNCNYAYSANPYVQNFVLGHLVLYPYTLSSGRVGSHWGTGSAGGEGFPVWTGIGQVLTWGGIGIPRGGVTTFSSTLAVIDDGIKLGPFYQLAGQSAADGINGAVLSDGGMVYAAPTGTLITLPRWSLFDQTPVFTLGDAIDNSQVQYLPDETFEYDNTYLYNAVQVTRQNGPNQSITVTSKDFTSDAEYFPRTALQQTISTTSDLDVYTLSQFELANYSQPQLRVQQVTIDAASNPFTAFPAVLSLVVSDVVTVTRSPVPGQGITAPYIIEKVTHKIGGTLWQTSYQISPYVQDNSILALDKTGYNQLGFNSLA